MHTIPIGTISNLPIVMEELGFDGWGFIERFSLSPRSFIKPLTPIPISLYGEILRAAVIFTGKDELPILLGAQAKLENLGPLRYLLASTTSVHEALNALIRFRRIWFPGLNSAITEERGLACMTIFFTEDFPGDQQVRTAFLAAMVRHLEIAAGQHVKIEQLSFSRSKPANISVYRKQFGIRPQFSQTIDAVYFDAKLLRLERTTTLDSEINIYMRQQLTAMEISLGSSFIEQVSQLIETLLMGGHCNIEKVADIFGIHRLTLYRQLQKHDATFQTLLEDKRQALAKSLLRRDSISVADIADVLGYRASTNFTRAFQRWTGYSPRTWRKQQTK